MNGGRLTQIVTPSYRAPSDKRESALPFRFRAAPKS
jgi:hypothetical protein